jgi:type VI secretion system Hcp family effector
MSFDAYLYFSTDSGISGESSTDLKKLVARSGCGNPIEITDFDPVAIEIPVAENRSASTAAVAGRAALNPFSCGKQLDTSTTALMKHCLTGKNIETIYCDIYRSTGEANGKPTLFMAIRYTNCVISESTIDGSGDELPKEKLTFTYQDVEYKYTQLDDKGKPQGSTGFLWSTRTNKGSKF